MLLLSKRNPLVLPGEFLYLQGMRTGSPKFLSHGSEDSWDTTGVLLDETALTRPIDFAALFGNSCPVEMEIGTGKGTFLLARASARPDLNFLGIEWARAYCLHAADRFRRNGLQNVRMLRMDAAELFRHYIPDASLWRLHIYFPDPWPKKRHHRRRLIQKAFVAQVHRALKIGGQLIVVTDHLDYFGQIRSVLAGQKRFATVPFPRLAGKEGELVGTNFERKYIAEGRPFYWTARMKY